MEGLLLYKYNLSQDCIYIKPTAFRCFSQFCPQRLVAITSMYSALFNCLFVNAEIRLLDTFSKYMKKKKCFTFFAFTIITN